MLRTALLGGNSITLDADMSKYIETLSEQGVIEGLEVSSGSVAPGKAWVKATRSNGETIMVLVQNTQAHSISLNGDVFVGIEIDQNAINNGALNNEDGTGIASIKVGPQKPNQNYLLLAVQQGGRLSDKREIIPKLQSLSSRTTTLEEKVKASETKITKLEDKGTPQYLGKFVEVGEAYQAGDVMVERGGKLIQKFSKIIVPDATHSSSYNAKRIGEFVPEQGERVFVEIDLIDCSESTSPELRFNTTDSDYDNRNINIYRIQKGITKNIKIPLTKYTGGPIFIYLSHNGTHTTTKISGMKIRSERSGTEPYLYPREEKGVGERVECTIIGIHNNSFVKQFTTIEKIDKQMIGEASGSWIAPRDGLLLFQSSSSKSSNYDSTVYVNGVDVREYLLYQSYYASDSSTNGLYFGLGILQVKGGTTYTLKTQTVDYRYKSTLILRYFISL